jgi:cyclopropane fatty-acyl-phospholipid synthase-like methyltransferase
MHKAKLQSAFEALPNIFLSKISIVDWGCGQGIASMIFIEKFGADLFTTLLSLSRLNSL